jgi:hypothetical protein
MMWNFYIHWNFIRIDIQRPIIISELRIAGMLERVPTLDESLGPIETQAAAFFLQPFVFNFIS